MPNVQQPSISLPFFRQNKKTNEATMSTIQTTIYRAITLAILLFIIQFNRKHSRSSAENSFDSPQQFVVGAPGTTRHFRIREFSS
jgi:hypothetical protein